MNYLIRKYPESPYAAQAKALLAAPAPKEELQKIDQEAQEKSAENKKKGKKFLFF